MRSMLNAPRRKFTTPTKAAVNGIAHWQLQESSGTTITDAFATHNLSGSGMAFVTTDAFMAADGTTVARGRRFTASNHVLTGAIDTPSRDACLNGKIVCEATFTLDSLSADAGIVGVTNSANTSQATNALFILGVTAAGALGVWWQNGSGLTVVSVATDPGVIVVGQLHTVSVRRWFSGGVVVVDFVVDGKVVGRKTSVLPPTAVGGSSAGFRIGNVKAAIFPSGSFLGTLYEVRMSIDANELRSIDYLRSGAARLFQRVQHDKIARSQNYNVFSRVMVQSPAIATSLYVRDDLSYVDLDGLEPSTTSEWNLRKSIVDSIDIEEDIDGDGAAMSFSCAREVFGWRYSPLITATAVNKSSEPVFALSRGVRVEVAVVSSDTSREDVQAHEWMTLFDGFMSSVDFAKGIMAVRCRDRMAPIQFTFCRPLAVNNYEEKQYGDDTTGVAIETVLQQIINDHVPAGGILGGTPIVYTPTSPAWALRKRSIGFSPLADVLSDKVTQIGWALRHRWDDNLRQLRYTFFRPERSAPSVVRTFALGEYLDVTEAEINEDTIRNVCEVVYGSRTATTRTDGGLARERVVVVDSVSVARYGERYCQIEEESASQIDTVTEATALATAVVQDLAQPKALVSMSMRLFPWVQLDDYYTITARDQFETQDFAVVGIKHRLSSEKHETVLSLRGKPAGRVDWWLGNVVVSPGVAPYVPVWPSGLSPASVTLRPGAGGVLAKWKWPGGAPTARGFDVMEVHAAAAGTSGAWTPTDATRIGTTRSDQIFVALDDVANRDIKLVMRDRVGASTTPLYAGEVAPRFDVVAPAVYANRTTAYVNTAASYALPLNNEIVDALGNFSASTTFTAPVSGLYTFDVGAEVDRAGKSGTARLRVFAGGSFVRDGVTSATFTATMPVGIAGTIYLTSGQTMSFIVDQSTTSSPGGGVAATSNTFLHIALARQT